MFFLTKHCIVGKSTSWGLCWMPKLQKILWAGSCVPFTLPFLSKSTSANCTAGCCAGSGRMQELGEELALKFYSASSVVSFKREPLLPTQNATFPSSFSSSYSPWNKVPFLWQKHKVTSAQLILLPSNQDALTVLLCCSPVKLEDLHSPFLKGSSKAKIPYVDED